MTTSEMSPEQIEKDIERTREDLRQNVDALQEKLSPTHAAKRGAARLGESVSQARDTLMGTAEDVKGSAEDQMTKAQESVSGVSEKISSGARGNPIAVGLGAFAIGWLVSSLIPATKTERRAAESLRDSDMAAAAVQPVADTARAVVENTEEKAKEAAREVGREAQSAVSSVTDSVGSKVSEASNGSSTGSIPPLQR